MSIKVNNVNGMYTLVNEEVLGIGYTAVKVTKYAYVGIKNNVEGFRQYDIIGVDGRKVMTIENNREMYVEAGGIDLKKDHFEVTFHQRMATAEMIHHVSFDYQGNRVHFENESVECKSNRDAFDNTNITPVSQVADSEDEDIM